MLLYLKFILMTTDHSEWGQVLKKCFKDHLLILFEQRFPCFKILNDHPEFLSS